MNLVHRFYSDYLLPSRISEYDLILRSALDKGYNHLTLPEFRSLVMSGKLDSNSRLFLHRHDIDTDIATARMLFNTEKKYGIRASYYFRLSTLDFKLMKEIKEYGSEVGYHYEEIAAYCKFYGIKDSNTVTTRFDDIRENFMKNLAIVEKGCGFKIRSIASHGDFVNRRLGVSNHYFIDSEFLSSNGIDFECYDPKLISKYSIIISDAPYPKFYIPVDPLKVINDGHQVIYMLTHPRHWRASVHVNIKDNILRIWEGLKYKFL